MKIILPFHLNPLSQSIRLRKLTCTVLNQVSLIFDQSTLPLKKGFAHKHITHSKYAIISSITAMV